MLIFSCNRFYKNKVKQKPGWDWNMLLWCLDKAKKNNLQEQDYWGGLILDEMKIQVRFKTRKLRICSDSHPISLSGYYAVLAQRH
jgi:hypothetical protein